ncbi:MAG: hypothetical protein COZ06_27080 [Armatimonadetes bacterium CG_4_10_14_3_um_filter_66_18]|nr:GldG family protein [Armatimonadota bacterium]OIP07144.1 MAG: hypothetical protein AUJ96_08115 [Armatimonadetes bacterium CG2_30_66_41]PIU93806.1 MAG: hypothetical protein COS65_10835 [Armatimonadetes bacterium CG06_land_8_20_14_3_00_66_21]PIX44233.1 MAG: hypothetical protein COZ57_17880 [Armatimonadetes bacterium CG_4_8_14_3_um_filter_66_20]PIY41124.1 MAG: hypothetical protein COZ06_27080 [Armatimonadetes bacterium CG_4_10_14_3_um_filter_66_18]PIZ34680.1 MAG: hypothetical protein COY42_281
MARTRKKKPETFMEAAAGPAAFAGVLIVLLGFAAMAVAQKLNLYVYAIFAVGLVLFAAALAAKPTEALAFLKSRQAKLGANATVTMLLFLGIIVLVNIVSNRHHTRLDLTKNKVHTLSPQTKKILKSLKTELKVTAFYSSTGGGDFQRVRDLLEGYRFVNPAKVKVKVVDPNLHPSLAKAYNISSLSTTVFECPKTEKKENVSSGDEQDFTSAILKVTKDQKKKFYFLQGHGEHKWDGYDEEGLSSLKAALEKQNHECAELNLMTQQTIPADCTVLVLCGPKLALHEQETDTLRDYLEAHGRAMLMIDPPTRSDPEAEELSGLLSRWGVTPVGKVVVEPVNNLFNDPSVVTVTKYEQHEITKPLGGYSYASLFFLPAHLKLEETTPPPPDQYGGPPPQPTTDFEVHSLAKSSAESWEVTNYSPQDFKQRPSDSKGPFDLAAVVTSGAPQPPPNPYGPPPPEDKDGEKTRLVVVADSNCATNAQLFGLRQNANFLMNALNWLAEESELIAIQPKDRTKNTITLTGSQETLVKLLSRYLLPLTCFLTGLVVWWKRR